MYGFFLIQLLEWVFLIGMIGFGVSRVTGKRKGAGNTKTNRSMYYERKTVQPQQKSFAAMPEQKSTVPNVKRPYTEHPTQTREKRNKNRISAIRLYEGDSIPKGYRMVRCRYCAAENLIAYSSKGAYMCYFCHEDL